MNKAWTLDSTKRQWVDLGIHTEACMSNMECGSGGALSLWLRVTYCEAHGGIISSLKPSVATSTAGYCNTNSVM